MLTVPTSEDAGPLATAAFLTKKARGFDDALAAAQPRVLGNSDPEAVHDLRVALRRLRTLLKLARPIFGGFHTDAVRTAFAELQAATGDLRDEEVLSETLDALGIKDARVTEWRKRRRARDRRLRANVVGRIRHGELDRARTLLNALLALPVRPSRDVPLARFARRMVRRAQGGVEERRDTPESDVVGLHDLRIAYKKLRYAVEIFAEALPADLAAMAEPAARFQKRLGDIHDLDVAKVAMARARGLDPRARQRIALALDAAREKKLAKYIAEMKPVAAPPPAVPPPT